MNREEVVTQLFTEHESLEVVCEDATTAIEAVLARPGDEAARAGLRQAWRALRRSVNHDLDKEDHVLLPRVALAGAKFAALARLVRAHERLREKARAVEAAGFDGDDQEIVSIAQGMASFVHSVEQHLAHEEAVILGELHVGRAIAS
jgi:hemerythrin-like domain-containing protein